MADRNAMVLIEIHNVEMDGVDCGKSARECRYNAARYEGAIDASASDRESVIDGRSRKATFPPTPDKEYIVGIRDALRGPT